jgi:hypothetical protein
MTENTYNDWAGVLASLDAPGYLRDRVRAGRAYRRIAKPIYKPLAPVVWAADKDVAGGCFRKGAYSAFIPETGESITVRQALDGSFRWERRATGNAPICARDGFRSLAEAQTDAFQDAAGAYRVKITTEGGAVVETDPGGADR